VPAYDPEVEAQRFLEFVASEDWTVRRQEGCVAIQHLYNHREYWFEIPSQMNRTRTEAFPYLFTDYLAYLGRIHDSFQWGEYNAWADDHHVVLMKDFRSPKAFFELEWQLQQKGLPYMKKRRCQFETIFVTTSDHLTIFQFKYICQRGSAKVQRHSM